MTVHREPGAAPKPRTGFSPPAVEFAAEEAHRHHQYDQPPADKKEYEVMIMAKKGTVKARVARVERAPAATKKAAEAATPRAEYWDDPAWNPPITRERIERIGREHPEFDEEYRENVRRGRAIGCPEIGLVA